MTFCARYLDDVETKCNQSNRNFEGDDEAGRAVGKGKHIKLDVIT